MRKSGKKSVLRKMNEMTTPNIKTRIFPRSFFGRSSSKHLMIKKIIAEKMRKRTALSTKTDSQFNNWLHFSPICFAGSTAIKNPFLSILSKYFSFGKDKHYHFGDFSFMTRRFRLFDPAQKRLLFEGLLMKKEIKMNNSNIAKGLFDKVQQRREVKKFLRSKRREEWRNLSAFKKWVRLSETAMFMSPILLAVSLNMKALIVFLIALSIVAIFYSLRFYRHVRLPRKSSLFAKRSTIFGRFMGFWCLFLFSLFAVGINNISKMRSDQSFKKNQSASGQERIKIDNRRQGKENNAA